MYNKLRYSILHQRAQSTTCETLAGQMVVQRLESEDGTVDADIADQWRAKRDDYALAPQSLPFLLLDYMVLQAQNQQQRVVTSARLAVGDLNQREQCLAAEYQRHWISTISSVQRARNASPREQQTGDLLAAALLAALNAGAWLDAFLWRHANRETPINLF